MPPPCRRVFAATESGICRRLHLAISVGQFGRCGLDRRDLLGSLRRAPARALPVVGFQCIDREQSRTRGHGRGASRSGGFRARNQSDGTRRLPGSWKKSTWFGSRLKWICPESFTRQWRRSSSIPMESMKLIPSGL